MKGKVIRYNQKNINTDLIIPARYLTSSDSNLLALHCMEDLDPQFTQKMRKNDYSVLVAGSNFGCGSSREHAPLALKSIGIKIIIAPSFARIFFRNAINIGLKIIEFSEISSIFTGDILDINLKEGLIKNLTRNEDYAIQKNPKFLQEIINEGGLVNFARRNYFSPK
ncbi:MAG: 3-isopropylmalate dehydratase small subunit [Promethearchaeota archaeon]|nr:MAG: 3-isopropylmalate dehydratase small subunit [Candidatus Lokiarchaeota archaeon]